MREILEDLKRQADLEIMKIAPQAQRKYKKVPVSTRRQFLNLVHKKKMSIKKAAESLEINYSSAKTILAQHRSNPQSNTHDLDTQDSKQEYSDNSMGTTQVHSPKEINETSSKDNHNALHQSILSTPNENINATQPILNDYYLQNKNFQSQQTKVISNPAPLTQPQQQTFQLTQQLQQQQQQQQLFQLQQLQQLQQQESEDINYLALQQQQYSQNPNSQLQQIWNYHMQQAQIQMIEKLLLASQQQPQPQQHHQQFQFPNLVSTSQPGQLFSYVQAQQQIYQQHQLQQQIQQQFQQQNSQVLQQTSQQPKIIKPTVINRAENTESNKQLFKKSKKSN